MGFNALLGSFRKVRSDLITNDIAIENRQVFCCWLLDSFTSLHIKLAIVLGALHCSPFEKSVVEKGITVSTDT